MDRIVECVPNFSEGRRPEVVDAIVKAITSVGGVYLLDREMDVNHNRAVITFVGPPECVGQAAIRGVEAAMEQIDLRTHRGEHPRIGAADVIPFVPIRGVTLSECVDIARETGRAIAERLHIPVYLYEAAATRPERVNLENIRRGQFEGLQQAVETDPERRPDFGEARMHPSAGATVVGARKPLIAYNINLNTPDVAIAKQIAKRIRSSSGGFPCVKAMGLLLHDRNQAQVSMNLTDFERTSVPVVFEAVRSEAQRLGVEIAGSEIVGLIPQEALEQAAVSYLRLENFKPELILENRLSEVMSGIATSGSGSESLRSFVRRVASADPTPGGGSVSALSGALGAALGQMAIRITKDKKDYRQHGERYAAALELLGRHTSTLLELTDADSEAFSRVLAAYRLPKSSPARESAIQEALVDATDTPARTATVAGEALGHLEDLRSIIHANVVSDFQVALEMLRSSMRGAMANVRVNLASLTDTATRDRYEKIMATCRTLADPEASRPSISSTDSGR